MEAMKNIEIQAMVDSGVPIEYAKETVEAAVEQLIGSGINNPINIPWN